MQFLRQFLTQCVGVRASATAGQWITNRMFGFEPSASESGDVAALASDGPRTDAFEAAFAGVGRRFGYSLATLTSDELRGAVEGWARSRLSAPAYSAWSEQELAVLLQGQPLATLARIALLSAWIEGAKEDTRAAVLNRVFHTGDAHEREAVLRALPLLPQAEQFLELGIEACRTHMQSVFEALAFANPYPARFFPEAAFNQMVVKCLFTEAPLGSVLGLSERRNVELQRMAGDYESERRAAGRSVPLDIELVKTLT